MTFLTLLKPWINIYKCCLLTDFLLYLIPLYNLNVSPEFFSLAILKLHYSIKNILLLVSHAKDYVCVA